MMADVQSKIFPLNIILKFEEYGAIKFYSKNSGVDNYGLNKQGNQGGPDCHIRRFLMRRKGSVSIDRY